jgi:hypothetical protein
LKPTDRRISTAGHIPEFRTATQGDRNLRKLGNFSRFIPELLNLSLKGYFCHPALGKAVVIELESSEIRKKVFGIARIQQGYSQG